MKDVVEAFLTAGKGGADGGAYNVGTGVITEVEALLEILSRCMGKNPVSVEKASLRPSEVFRIGLDARAFKRETGWRHSFSLEEGISAFVESLET